jgi:hypothetical protein
MSEPRYWPLTGRSVPLQMGAVAHAQNGAPAADGVNFLTLSWEGSNSG